MSFPPTYDNATLHKPCAMCEICWNLYLCFLYKQRLSFHNKLEIKHSTNSLTFLAVNSSLGFLFFGFFFLPNCYQSFGKNPSGRILPELHFNLLNDEEEVSMDVWYLRKLCDILVMASQQCSRESGLETRKSCLGVSHYLPKKSQHSQQFQLAASFEKTRSYPELQTENDNLPLTFPSLSGRASQDAATEVGLPFNGQTSKFSGALVGAVKQTNNRKGN